MPKRIDYTLKEDELAAIEAVMAHDGRATVVQRATGIRLLHLGYAPQEVARQLAVRMPTVYNWHRRWREQGIAGLVDLPRPGRPLKTDERYVQELEQTLERTPADYGYDFAIWTIGRLVEHLAQRTGIVLSEDRLRVLMGRRGYVYRRPKHDLSALQNASERAQVAALLEELKKAPSAVISSSSLWTKRP